MNVKRYVGRSTRDAMRLLREELGPDALILANRSCPEGVEILAASADAADTLTLGAALQPMAAEIPARVPARAEALQSRAAADTGPGRQSARDALGGADLAPMSTVSFQDYVRQRLRERSQEGSHTQPKVTADDGLAVPTRSGRGLFAQPVQPVPTLGEIAAQAATRTEPIDASPVKAAPVKAAPVKAAPFKTAPVKAAPTDAAPIKAVPIRSESVDTSAVQPDSHSADRDGLSLATSARMPAHDAMVQELQSLKGMIANQFDTMRWFDDVARDPGQAALLRQMMEAGFSLPLARTVVGRLPQGFNAVQSQAWLAAVLARNLRCLTPDEGFDGAGVYALVGPTGVGKTTTTAKIAARHVLRHGSQSVALITVDTYRMGAHEQLRAYGRILNVPVHVAHDAAALHDLLRLRQERQLVLIDTVGMGQHDERIADLLGMLPASQVQRVMVASAAAQPESIEESLQAFEAPKARGLVLTKLDETARLGGALDCAIRARLPLMGFCDGQRVPEDWQQADASRLIRRALQSRTPKAFSLESHSLSTVVGVGAARPSEQAHA